MSDPKETNPKSALGIAKAPASTLSAQVMLEVGVAMLEGALKYGRHNYRVTGARASVYYDATRRHLDDWFEGEDIDPDSGLSHIAKAIASLMVLRDAMLQGLWTDDRPPKAKAGWMAALNERVKVLLAKYPDPKPAATELGMPHLAEKKPSAFQMATPEGPRPVCGKLVTVGGDRCVCAVEHDGRCHDRVPCPAYPDCTWCGPKF